MRPIGSGELAQLEVDDLQRWPRPDPDANKYSRAVVGIDSGSKRYPGAGLLNVIGAAFSGASFIRYCGTDAAREAILTRVPAVTFGTGHVGAWCLGSGWDPDEFNQARLAARLASGVPLVVDAGALQFAATGLPDNSLLTPHAGELARLLGISRADVEADPLGQASCAAQRCNATVLLKGATQYCVAPTGEALVAVRGPAWSAQAGSGDVLAGIAAVGLAAGLDAVWAGGLAASLQAYAASVHPGPYPPDQLAEFLPWLLGGLETQN